MLLRAVIAEDDDFFRNKLIDKVSAIEGLEVAYSTDNGADLVNTVKKIKPEVIITDIDMPAMSGIDAIKSIREEMPYTEIIFITSYSKFIRDAYKLYASDFIEKPIDDKRFLDTIERIKNRFISVDKVICFKTKDSIECVKPNDVYFFEAMKRKTRIYTSYGVFNCNYSMKKISTMLDERIFYRASKSYIVNITKINRIKVYSRNSYQLSFNDTKEIAYLSKINYKEFLDKMDNVYKL